VSPRLYILLNATHIIDRKKEDTEDPLIFLYFFFVSFYSIFPPPLEQKSNMAINISLFVFQIAWPTHIIPDRAEREGGIENGWDGTRKRKRWRESVPEILFETKHKQGALLHAERERQSSLSKKYPTYIQPDK
jgi:hypothetical protein